MHKTTLPRSFCNVISLHFKIGCGWRSLFGINPFRINKTNFCPNMGWKKSKLKKLLWGDINKQKLLRMCAFISSSSFIFFISASTSSSQRYIFTPPPIIRGQILFRCSIFFFMLLFISRSFSFPVDQRWSGLLNLLSFPACDRMYRQFRGRKKEKNRKG